MIERVNRSAGATSGVVLSAALVAIVSIAVVWAANLFGLWWVTPLVGLAIALLVRRGALGVAGLAGLLGWGGPLAWQALSVPIGAAASTVAGIMGVGSGVIVIALTLLLGLLLCAAGAWLGIALLRLTLPA